MTLIILGAVVYAFRPRDERTMILQQLGKYSMIEQTLARLVLVTCFQILVDFPLSLLLMDQGAHVSMLHFYIWKAVVMLFSIGIIVEVGNACSYTVEMLTSPQSNDFYIIRWFMLFTAAVVLFVFLLSQRKRGNE
ncbi:hypothetical protein MNQ98_13530 [Paenibacillus sp. N3/727]|uniref:hypothetical protein n=1 Tax=Paenibacillus sp. N3/727 TaxID=2925845 RepID=UPI001F5326D4|nr:hypothetical protein [Paenibacillus sp. N3/727]UNK20970.1 hypothetical protein MNQ98_13530 [Paenibacillus sp. N3/727]